jgi:hypothetical protein
MEAMYGDWQPGCTQPGCQARLHGNDWKQRPGWPHDDHEHRPAARPGQLDAAQTRLANQAWGHGEGAVLIRLLIHEHSDPGQIEDLFVILDRNDLVEAQTLPAIGREAAWCSPSGKLTPALIRTLVSAAGDLWHSTGGHDPHDVLSTRQRQALDLAAEITAAAEE